MGRAAREKGKRGERMTAAELRAAFVELSDTIKRGWQCREGDDDPDICGIPGFWIENKSLARFNTKPLDQAIHDADGQAVPIAVIRVDRKTPVAMLRWPDLLALLSGAVYGVDNES